MRGGKLQRTGGTKVTAVEGPRTGVFSSLNFVGGEIDFEMKFQSVKHLE